MTRDDEQKKKKKLKQKNSIAPDWCFLKQCVAVSH
jgi:hypothetical protein